jgi:AraC-like DNA-binding protein
VEVLAVVDTPVRLTIQGKTHTLLPGDLYIVFPNLLHAIEARNAQAMVLLVDFEKYPAFHDVLLHNHPENPVLRKGQYPSSVLHAMERMVALSKANLPYQQETLAGYANAVLGELLSQMQLVPRNMDGSLVQQLQFYILENYTRDITLDSAAQALGYSKYYISRYIADLFGCNFRTLINSYRIALAQNLLLSGSQSIGQIALDCGYKSQSAFNRTFLQQTGLTPKEYRQRTAQPPPKPTLCKK